MAIALKLNTSTGQLNRFAAADNLEVQALEPRNTGAALVIGNTLASGQEVQIGNTNADTRIMGDLFVDGSSTVTVDETVTGNFTVEGNVQLGDGGGDTIDIGDPASLGADTINLNSDLIVGAGARSIGSSVTDYLDGIWLDAVNANGPSLAGYDLNASGTNAGAYAIGVDPALIGNSASTDLMTMLVDLDAAITGGGGNNLQQAYEALNTIAVTSGEGIIDFSNDTAADTTTVLQISRTPGSSTGGLGLDVAMGANTTGAGIRVVQSGSGVAALFDNLSLKGDTLSGSAELTLESNATSATSINLSQDGDRTLDTSGVLSGATSIVGALNRLAASGPQESIPIENGVTIAAGDTVAQSTVSGRATQANNNGDTNSRVIGIATTGGTGDAGGTVEANVALPTSLVTIGGASFTPGGALFAPDGTGSPVETAPADVGDVVQRVGWARTATDFIVDLGVAVIL